MNLESTTLEKWNLDECVSNTREISAYIKNFIRIEPVNNGGEKIATISVDDTITEISANTSGPYIHLSGDSNIGHLSLSGNFNIGKNNEIIGKNSVAFGENCKTGLRYYEIISVDQDLKTITIRENVTNIPDSVIGTKASLLTDGLPGIDFADVMSVESVDENATKVGVSNWHNKLQKTASNNLFFFSKFPELGKEIAANDALAIGINCKVLAKAGTSFGEDCIVNGARGHAEGYNAIAGWAAHAEGQNVIAGTVCSHCEGRSNSTDAYISHVEGFGNAISAGNAAVGSHVAGIAAQSQHEYSFVWSGENRPDADGKLGNYTLNKYYPLTRYSSHGKGTFNVNPLSGIDGFFIGDKCITEYFGADLNLKSKIYNAVSSILNAESPKSVELTAITAMLSNLALILKPNN